MKRLNLLFFLAVCTSVLAFGQFKLAPLPYSYKALEPYIDSTTMYIHYNFHHQTYANNLNKALAKYPELYKKDILDLLKNLNELPKEIQTNVKNQGGGYYNHTFFWSVMAPAGTAKMSPKMTKLLFDNFGSVDAFKAEFEKAAASRFGSGWVWLIKDGAGKLSIISTPNQENPYMPDAKVKGTPILTLDVWEHAYYLKYQYKRADYVKAWWNVVNWTEVERLFGK